ncbi:hypothetical protein CHS0354_009882 [Potamilus streckersoni]|uniref:Uncharacterized protein n=1 Tax=Potamilus streckersoni TaxID=2493646 RepID=A0AAE0S4M2_9BIVA|nr:hypothetical protein CHS0354_009882 [Potamilus streckersoni]
MASCIGRVRKDICLLMRCSDPKTGICLGKYHGAARGTECGTNEVITPLSPSSQTYDWLIRL